MKTISIQMCVLLSLLAAIHGTFGNGLLGTTTALKPFHGRKSIWGSATQAAHHHYSRIHLLQQYYELRCRQVQKLRETQSPNPYPHKFHVSRSITAYISEYGPEGKIPPGQRLQGITESLAGRIHNIRASGQKLRFYDLHGEGKKVQIMATLQQVFFLFAHK
jgi:lysyl-tRNA synthetase class II